MPTDNTTGAQSVDDAWVQRSLQAFYDSLRFALASFIMEDGHCIDFGPSHFAGVMLHGCTSMRLTEGGSGKGTITLTGPDLSRAHANLRAPQLDFQAGGIDKQGERMLFHGSISVPSCRMEELPDDRALLFVSMGKCFLQETDFFTSFEPGITRRVVLILPQSSEKMGTPSP